MTRDLRWRVLSLEIVMAIVLAVGAGFLYWGASFTRGSIHDELVAQRINFPAASSPAITSLPAADRQAMTVYAGQVLDNGDKAQTYANHFIAVHLREAAGGNTYSQESGLAMAHPKDAALAATVQTLFRGETLRGLLLNAWGWWTVGTYALYLGIVLNVGAVVVLGAFLFEFAVAARRVTPRVAQPVPARL